MENFTLHLKHLKGCFDEVMNTVERMRGLAVPTDSNVTVRAVRASKTNFDRDTFCPEIKGDPKHLADVVHSLRLEGWID